MSGQDSKQPSNLMMVILTALGNVSEERAEHTTDPPQWLTDLRTLIENVATWMNENMPSFAFFFAFSPAILDRFGCSEAPLKDLPFNEHPVLLERLAEVSEEEGQELLDNLILGRYRENGYARLFSLVREWSDPLFSKRARLFEDAAWAHKHGKYTLSMPAVAAQIEGIVRELTGEYDRDTEWKKRFNKAFGYRYDPKSSPGSKTPEELLEGFNQMTWPEQFTFAQSLRVRLNLGRIDDLFRSGDFADPDFVGSLNRHAILHGVFEDYEEVKSLRLFFILDLLHDAVSEYRE